MPYSIGYTTLVDANSYSLGSGRIINKAGAAVAASADSVSYAVMEKGGDLDARMNAVLVDGSSLQVRSFFISDSKLLQMTC